MLTLTLGAFAGLVFGVCWELRAPSDLLFIEADSYYAAAEAWQREFNRLRVGEAGGVSALAKRDQCLREAHKLARKALRRMEWRML